MQRCFLARQLAGVCLLALAACSSLEPITLPQSLPPRVSLPSVAFFPQQDNWCGPASLASLLVHAGISVTPEQLAPQVFLPGRQGALNLELLAASRRHGLMPYVLQGDNNALLQELAAGHPILVLLDLGMPPLSRWHYAVLTGYDSASREFQMISGEQANSRIEWAVFQRLWARGQNWAMLVTVPGTLPATAELMPLLQQGAALEQMGRFIDAGKIYAAAATRWPQSAALWFASGNVAYRAGDRAAAEARWQQALLLDADLAAARHNLVELLRQQGRHAEAARLLKQGLLRDPQQPLLRPLTDSMPSAAD